MTANDEQQVNEPVATMPGQWVHPSGETFVDVTCMSDTGRARYVLMFTTQLSRDEFVGLVTSADSWRGAATVNEYVDHEVVRGRILTFGYEASDVDEVVIDNYHGTRVAWDATVAAHYGSYASVVIDLSEGADPESAVEAILPLLEQASPSIKEDVIEHYETQMKPFLGTQESVIEISASHQDDQSLSGWSL